MTEREAPSRDFDYPADDFDDDGWFGHAPLVQEPRTEPIPLTPELVDSPTQPEAGHTDDHAEPEQISVHPDLIEQPAQEPDVSGATVNGVDYETTDDHAPTDELVEPQLNGAATYADDETTGYHPPAADPVESDLNGATTYVDTEPTEYVEAMSATHTAEPAGADPGYEEPEPEPVYEEFAAPTEADTPEPAFEPEPQYAPEPEPEPETEFTPEPEPVYESEPAPEPAPVAPAPVPESRTGPAVDPSWTKNGQLRLTEFDPLEFKATPQPWYRSRKAVMSLVAAAALLAVLLIVTMVMRSPTETTGPAPAPSTTPAPATSSAPAVPSAVEPTLSRSPAPPPPPPPPPPAAPPPPPPPPAQNNAPAYTPRYQPPPRRADPAPAPKPDTGVTRAPISVAPDHKATPSGPEVGRHGANDGGAGWG